ncbi:methyltransferase domain-containing protein [Georhizobium profundi]|uniref:Methyltransferase domain-containing protein n=1 Tax=Georhizobium profundi TaxID=2341112 RepID=A0A3Q8XMS0_9HYPH|nr:class I SAM-dependent methyltransferase [Georhizobium profundi]AZN70082.1 methyltransferase domain-containing protein [Georhizobium profundi]
MVGTLTRKLSKRFDDEIRFFKGWMDGPKAVGSIVPTSAVTSRRMASVIDTTSGLPVLELGPGTGVVTKAILERGVSPNKLVCVEYSDDFVSHVRRLFPGVNVIQGDAFDLDSTLGPLADQTFDCVVSGIPLLNFPMPERIALIEDLLGRIPAGRPVVQITYGPRSPVAPGRGNYVVEKLDFVVRNIPPAHLWLYRRPI